MKLYQMLNSGYFRMPVIIVGALLLGACGGGGGSDGVGAVSTGTVTASAASTSSENIVATVPKATVPEATVPVATVPVPTTNPGSSSSVTKTGSIGLGWTAPTARADGTPLSLADISGYRVYYGASAGNYPNSADVPDGTATSTRVTGIPVGSYYLVMTTYDVNGVESGYSSAIRKTAL